MRACAYAHHEVGVAKLHQYLKLKAKLYRRVMGKDTVVIRSDVGFDVKRPLMRYPERVRCE